METRYPLFLFAPLFFTSCIKDDVKLPEQPELVNTEITNGMPENPGSINGYLYGSYSISSSNYTYLSAYCSFRDPGGELALTYDHSTDQETFSANSQTRGNIRTGFVSIYGLNLPELNMGNSISYRLNMQNAANINTIPRWKTNGNGSFKALDQTVPRGLPTILTPALTKTISISQDFVIDTRAIATNFDSLMVFFGSNFSSVKKRAGLNDRYIIFSTSDLYQIGTGSRNISIYAFNYSNRTIDSKVYLFELASKYITTIQLNQ